MNGCVCWVECAPVIYNKVPFGVHAAGFVCVRFHQSEVWIFLWKLMMSVFCSITVNRTQSLNFTQLMKVKDYIPASLGNFSHHFSPHVATFHRLMRLLFLFQQLLEGQTFSPAAASSLVLQRDTGAHRAGVMRATGEFPLCGADCITSTASHRAAAHNTPVTPTPPQRLPMCWPQLCLPPQLGPRPPSEPRCISEPGFSPFPSAAPHLPQPCLITAETRLCEGHVPKHTSNVHRHLCQLPADEVSVTFCLPPGVNS